MSPASSQILGSSFWRLHHVAVIGVLGHLCLSLRSCRSSGKHFLLPRLPHLSSEHFCDCCLDRHVGSRAPAGTTLTLRSRRGIIAVAVSSKIDSCCAVAIVFNLVKRSGCTSYLVFEQEEQAFHHQVLQTKAANQEAEPASRHCRWYVVLPSLSQECTLLLSPPSQLSDQGTCPPSSSSQACRDFQGHSRPLKLSSRPAACIGFAPRPQAIKHRRIIVVS